MSKLTVSIRVLFVMLGAAASGGCSAPSGSAALPASRHAPPAALSSSAPHTEPSPSPGAVGHEVPRPTWPEGALGPEPTRGKPCIAALEVRAERHGGAVHLEATLMASEPLTEPLVLELRGRCPGGPIEVHGLTAGYDVYGTCAAGACLSPSTVSRVTLPPGRSPVVVLALDLPIAGDACRAPLPSGRHDVHVSAELVSPESRSLCGMGHAWFELPPPTSEPTPPPTCPPPLACGIACPGGAFAKDARGCPSCACEEDPLTR